MKLTPAILIVTAAQVFACPGDIAPNEAGEHWAFQPITDPPVPEVANSAWVQTPIDAFVLAELEAMGLQPASAADPYTFLRRLSYNLTGLPPSFEEMRSYMERPDPDAAIDRLLASPHFGERWARHWLDVARYSDTKGYAYSPEEFTFVHAWVYRDWVVRAFNKDLPFDQFLVRQLAADRLLESGDCEKRDLAAMGFLTLGRRFVGVEQDIIDDRIDTVSRGMLALTISCSRCHDHKYDPIPTADYYALYGMFDSSHDKMVALQDCDDGVLTERRAKLQAEFDKHTAAVEKRHLERAAEYLVATLDMSVVPTPDFAEIFTKDDLNPEQTRRWYEYLSLEDKKNHPIFGAWKALAAVPAAEFAKHAMETLETVRGAEPLVLSALREPAPENMEDVARRYGRLLQEHSDHPAISDVVHGPGSPIAIPRGRHLHDIEWLFADDERTSMKKMLAEIERRIIELGTEAPHAVAMADQPVPENTRVLLRGNYPTQGDEVPRRAPVILGGDEFTAGSGRLEFANLIASADNPLTARVIVNRIWHHHFGTGLVNTPSDFGLRSETPSDPQLLDFLASRLIENGWSLKSIHRLIARSACYQQASTPSARSHRLDPENRLLSYFPRRRLDFESMRDSLLAASGELDSTAGGPPGALLGENATRRRSVYGRIDRQFLPNALRDFDFANPELHSPRRHLTNVPQQALFFMNSPFVEARAIALAKRAGDDSRDGRIRELFQFAYQRQPSEGELEASHQFIATAIASDTALKPEKEKQEPTPWSYGFGRFNAEAGKVDTFTPLPHFTGEAWGGSDAWPDAKLGWLRLTAIGGHTGNHLEHAAVRRWTSPVDGKLDIAGTISTTEGCGDGVRAMILCSRRGELQSQTVSFGETATANLNALEIAKGDVIDFVVDCGPAGNFSCDEFVWSPTIRLVGESESEWSAKKQFGGPAPQPSRQLDAWERFAHGLLLANPFIYID